MAANPLVTIPRNYQQWQNNVTPATDFNCDAGVFGLTVTASAWGTAQLQRLVVDPVLGAEYINVGPQITANGFTEYHLPAGQYHLAVAATTAFSGVFEKIVSGSR